MTANQIQLIESELQRRGYRKYIQGLTDNETYAWFKAFGKEENEDGKVVAGYLIAFRVWDWRREMAMETCISMTVNRYVIMRIRNLLSDAVVLNGDIQSVKSSSKERREIYKNVIKIFKDYDKRTTRPCVALLAVGDQKGSETIV